MDIYAQNIMDHYKHPHHRGFLVKADASHRALNRSCGDDITAFLKFSGDRIKQIKFIGQGCAISQAGISILSEELLNKTKTEISAYGFNEIRKIFGIAISERRYNCAMLGLRAIQRAIIDKP